MLVKFTTIGNVVLITRTLQVSLWLHNYIEIVTVFREIYRTCGSVKTNQMWVLNPFQEGKPLTSSLALMRSGARLQRFIMNSEEKLMTTKTHQTPLTTLNSLPAFAKACETRDSLNHIRCHPPIPIGGFFISTTIWIVKKVFRLWPNIIKKPWLIKKRSKIAWEGCSFSPQPSHDRSVAHEARFCPSF